MALRDGGGFLVDKSVWNKMKKNLLRGQNLAVKVGFFEESQYGPENDNLPVAQVAQWQEEGTDKIPMRPFIRYYVNQLQKEGKFIPEIAWMIHLVAMGNMSWTTLYKNLGKEAQEDLKRVIAQWEHPENADFTVAMKGFNDPLVETGKMQDSVDYKLGKK